MPNITAKDFNDRIFLKVIAWITIIICGIIVYYYFFTILKVILFDYQIESEISTFNTAMLMSFGILFFALLMLISGIGLLNLKNWGRAMFSILSWTSSISLVSYVIYFAIEYQKNKSDFMDLVGVNTISAISFLSYSIFLLILAWALVKVTIKLNRKDLKIHFDKKMGW